MVRRHTQKYLPHLFQQCDGKFEGVFNNLNLYPKDDECTKNIINYLDKLLCYHYSRNLKDKLLPAFFHLHFETRLDDKIKNLIAKFIVVWSFEHVKKLKSKSEENQLKCKVEETIKRLNKEKIKLCHIPENAKAGSLKHKQWKKSRTINNSQISHYTKLMKSNIKDCFMLFNSPIKYQNALKTVFNSKPYGVDCLQFDILPSYCILNAPDKANNINDLNDLDENYEDYGGLSDILEYIKTIILFDCTGNSWAEDFSQEDLNEWNQDGGTDFEHLIVVTFGKKNSDINYLQKRLKEIKEKLTPKKSENSETYVILKEELNTNGNEKNTIEIKETFFGLSTSDSWSNFVENLPEELGQLKSFHNKNLFNVCYTKEIKEHILNKLFPANEVSKYIGSENNETINELFKNENFKTLNETLSDFLDEIVALGINVEIQKSLKKHSKLIFDDSVIRDKKLCKLISYSLSMNGEADSFISWKQLESTKTESAVILSYRDQGNRFNSFYPNIYENSKIDQNIPISFYLLEPLFAMRYRQKQIVLEENLYKILNHPFRTKYFQWKRLKENLELWKQQSKDYDYLNYELENNYRFDERITCIINKDYSNQKTHEHSIKIMTINKNAQFKAMRISDLCDEFDEIKECNPEYITFEDISKHFEPPKELQKNQNALELELSRIRHKYGLKDTNDEKLWKNLLKLKVEEISDDIDNIPEQYPKSEIYSKEWTLYSQIKKYLKEKKLKMVSFNHFIKAWSQPEHPSLIIQNKKMFKELCSYLGLPNNYFRLLLRISNSQSKNKTKFTKKMNEFLTFFIEIGCFKKNDNIDEILTNNIEKIKRINPYNEWDLTTEELTEYLINSISLTKSNLQLTRVHSIEYDD